jgi:hypothetical protein
MVERIYPVGIQTFSDIIKRGCVFSGIFVSLHPEIMIII